MAGITHRDAVLFSSSVGSWLVVAAMLYKVGI